MVANRLALLLDRVPVMMTPSGSGESGMDVNAVIASSGKPQCH